MFFCLLILWNDAQVGGFSNFEGLETRLGWAVPQMPALDTVGSSETLRPAVLDEQPISQL